MKTEIKNEFDFKCSQVRLQEIQNNINYLNNVIQAKVQYFKLETETLKFDIINNDIDVDLLDFNGKFIYYDNLQEESNRILERSKEKIDEMKELYDCYIKEIKNIEYLKELCQDYNQKKYEDGLETYELKRLDYDNLNEEDTK